MVPHSFTFTVQPEDIEFGQVASVGYCPISLAIRKALQKECPDLPFIVKTQTDEVLIYLYHNTLRQFCTTSSPHPPKE